MGFGTGAGRLYSLTRNKAWWILCIFCPVSGLLPYTYTYCAVAEILDRSSRYKDGDGDQVTYGEGVPGPGRTPRETNAPDAPSLLNQEGGCRTDPVK